MPTKKTNKQIKKKKRNNNNKERRKKKQKKQKHLTINCDARTCDSGL